MAEYAYDANHQRVTKAVYAAGVLDSTRHYYYSQGWQILEERIDSSADAERQFTWGTRYVDDLILRQRDTDGNTSLDESLYAVQDAGWNITALADGSGTIVERFAYDPYGNSVVLNDDFSLDNDQQSDFDWEFRFTSREYDGETGLYQFRYRYYHAQLGRFINRDPLGYPDGMNTYAGYFVPGGVDPEGLESAGWNHSYPLYLGGAAGQPVIYLDEAQHTAFHDYFRDLFKENNVKNFRGFGEETRTFWKGLTDAERRVHIMNALGAAGVDDCTIYKNIDDIMANATPKKGATKRPWWNGPKIGQGRPPRQIPWVKKYAKTIFKVGVGTITVISSSAAFAQGYTGNGHFKGEKGILPAAGNVAHDYVYGPEVEAAFIQAMESSGGFVRGGLISGEIRDGNLTRGQVEGRIRTDPEVERRLNQQGKGALQMVK